MFYRFARSQLLMLLSVSLLLVGVALAQEAAPADPAVESSSDSSSETTVDVEAQETPADDVADKEETTPESSRRTRETFTPTEEISEDEPVSFPVDI